MSYITTQGNSILVDAPDSMDGKSTKPRSQESELVGWVVGKVRKWRDDRNLNYRKLWAEYWRMWRGQWSEADRNRMSERSRLIAPALAQAIEMTVAEIEEAVFSRELWFDVADDIEDQEKKDASIARDRLVEDFELANVKDAVSESVLNAAIFGTGILKIDVQVHREAGLRRDEKTMQLGQSPNERTVVCVYSIRPDEFVPDPAGKTIQEMLGCAHDFKVPVHVVLEGIEAGKYRRGALAELSSGSSNSLLNDVDEAEKMTSPNSSEFTAIIEYHGKIPARFLLDTATSPLDEVLKDDIQSRPENGGDGPLVEAIVTIANEGVLLRAMANPFAMQDRAIIAYSFEKVPARFWGRGVAEKGYNPQKALDAEIRARIDALGFISAPMMGVDVGRMPKGFKYQVLPGKVWTTQGPPNEILQPVRIGEISGTTFNQSQEMERMVQMGTGAFDTSSALGRGQTASGGNAVNAGSLFMGAFVKRSRRAIQQIDRNALVPLIQKSLWRYMQYAPSRYPQDYKFVVKATLGIVAREVEQLNLTQLMAMLPEEIPQAKLVVAKGMIELANVQNKAEIMAVLESAMQPNPQQEFLQQKQMELQVTTLIEQAKALVLQNAKTMAETREIIAKTMVHFKKADVEDDKVMIERKRTELMADEIEQFAQQNTIAMKRLDLQEQQLELKKKEVAKKPTPSK